MLPNWTFRLWDDSDNQQLMDDYFPEIATRFAAIRRGVVKADIARCAYLHAYGGWYMDTDYKLLHPIDTKFLEESCILPISGEDGIESPGFRVGNSVFASEPGFLLWSDFIADIFARFSPEELDESAVEKVTGPEGLTDFIRPRVSQYAGIHFVPRRFFHPLITRHGLSYDKTFCSYGAHLCWGSWRSKSPLHAIKTLLVRKVTSFT